MEGFNLKEFRDNKLAWTQVELAARLDRPQDQISRIESGTQKLTMELFLDICRVAGMSPNDVLAWQPSQAQPLDFGDPYLDLKAYKQAVEHYLTPLDAGAEAEELVKEVRHVLLRASKPLVALVGPSDAGKTRLLNTILGVEALRSTWTPTTAAKVYLRHKEDKPDWMETDDVWVFRAGSKGAPWDYGRRDDREYCKKLKMGGGTLSVLDDFCNHQSQQHADSAVVFVDAPILKSADFVDLPGFGTENETDTKFTHQVAMLADCTIFLCQSNGFFNKRDDILFLKSLLQDRTSVPPEGDKHLWNLFVVASQAAFVDDEAIEIILDRGCSAIARQLSTEVIQPQGNTDLLDKEHLRSRFFTYDAGQQGLRRRFEQELSATLGKIVPRLVNRNLALQIRTIRQNALIKYTERKKHFDRALSRLAQVADEIERQESERSQHNATIHRARLKVLDATSTFRSEGRNEMARWEQETITVPLIRQIIDGKKYNRKEAQEFIASNVLDLYQAHYTEILVKKTEAFKVIVQEALDALNHDLAPDSDLSSPSVIVPFDIAGAVAGAFASIAVLGALSMMADAAGNLGGYILVTQAVGFLSSIGISVGGSAAAVSTVAAIGGPVTLAIGIAMGTFLVVKMLFGDGWKDRMAKAVLKQFKKERVLDRHLTLMDKYWSDTETGVNQLADSLLAQYEAHINELRAMTASVDHTASLQRHADRMLTVFEGLPDPAFLDEKANA